MFSRTFGWFFLHSSQARDAVAFASSIARRSPMIFGFIICLWIKFFHDVHSDVSDFVGGHRPGVVPPARPFMSHNGGDFFIRKLSRKSGHLGEFGSRVIALQ